jgi:hypothetical protein
METILSFWRVDGSSGLRFRAYGWVAKMGVRIEARWTDDDGESAGRFHVIVQGQDCGPSVPCTAGAWLLTEARLLLMLGEVTQRAYEIGHSNAQAEMRRVLGMK